MKIISIPVEENQNNERRWKEQKVLREISGTRRWEQFCFNFEP